MERTSRIIRAGHIVLFALTLAIALAAPVYSLILSFVNYQPMYGLRGSAWAGFQNYNVFLQSLAAMPVIRNSLLLSALGLIMSALAIGIPCGWLTARIEQSTPRRIATAMLLLPAFVPTLCYTILGIGWLPIGWRTAPTQYPLAYLCMAVLPQAALTAFASALYAQHSPANASTPGFWHGAGWIALAAAFLLLTPDLETIHLTMNPANYATSDVLDTYAYRVGLTQSSFSSGSAVHSLKALLQGCLGTLLLSLFAFFRRQLRHNNACTLRDRPRRTLPWPVIILPLLILWIAGLLLLLNVPPMNSAADTTWPEINQFIATLVAALATLLFAFLFLSCLGMLLRRLNWPLTCLFMGLLLAFTNPTVGSFILSRNLGWLNTSFPIILFSALTPTCLILLLLMAKLHCAPRFPALLPACYAAAQAWSSTYTPMLFTINRSQYTLGLHARTASITGVQLIVTLLIPCLILGILGAWYATGRGPMGEAGGRRPPASPPA